MEIKMLYPDARWISEAEVVAWGHDRMLDAAVAAVAARAGRPLSDTEIADAAETVATPTFQEALGVLEDEGVATFSTEVR